MDNYYVYIYLDPRKPGKYQYQNISFLYEPIYVGEGKKKRFTAHISNAVNPILRAKLQHIKNENLSPFILFYSTNTTEINAYNVEKKLISQIGKIIEDTGPLTNFLDGGEGGQVTYCWLGN